MGYQLDVVMSGVVDSGREHGHGNIDANHPERTFAAQGSPTTVLLASGSCRKIA